MAPHIASFLLGSFGIVAAIVLIGGSTVLRAQQNRYRFELAKKSLESGVPLPTPEPLWKGLHRQAQSILAVGVGLLIVGGVAWWLGSGISRPENGPPPPPPPEPAMSFGRPVPPTPPSPEVEAWQRGQERVAIGQTAVGCGVILTLLGFVRSRVAKTERLSQPTAIAKPD